MNIEIKKQRRFVKKVAAKKDIKYKNINFKMIPLLLLSA